MNTPDAMTEAIEQELREVANPGDKPASPAIWQAALASVRGKRGMNRAPKGLWLASILSTRRVAGFGAAVVVLGAGILLVLTSMRSMYNAERIASTAAPVLDAPPMMKNIETPGVLTIRGGRTDWGGNPSAAAEYKSSPEFDVNSVILGLNVASPVKPLPPPAPTTDDAEGRQVIHKVALDLKSKDVRGVYHKAQMVVNAGAGEFIENSLISGQDDSLRATLTLRVMSARLASVRQQLRDLGQVVSENATGEDVTDRILDLDANIRNERRVERELIELFDARKDAPLKEILELRDHLAQVRGVIERLEGQKAAATKLVALATVLVNIAAEVEDKPAAEPEKTSLGQDILNGLSSASERGIRALGRSLAWLVEVAIGGLVAWLFLAFLGITVVVLARRLLRDSWKERAPAV